MPGEAGGRENECYICGEEGDVLLPCDYPGGLGEEESNGSGAASNLKGPVGGSSVPCPHVYHPACLKRLFAVKPPDGGGPFRCPMHPRTCCVKPARRGRATTVGGHKRRKRLPTPCGADALGVVCSTCPRAACAKHASDALFASSYDADQGCAAGVQIAQCAECTARFEEAEGSDAQSLPQSLPESEGEAPAGPQPRAPSELRAALQVRALSVHAWGRPARALKDEVQGSSSSE